MFSLSSLFNILSPRRCLICFNFLAHPLVMSPPKSGLDNFLCAVCQEQLKVCATTSMPSLSTQIDQVLSGYQYCESMAKIIPAWKYQGRSEFFPLIRILVLLMLNRLDSTGLNFDLVMAIPLTGSALKKRGFNQALFIAYSCAKELKLSLGVHQLVKDINTHQQASLGRDERVSNLGDDAFRLLDQDVVKGRRILLCDDVLTTGTTLRTAAVTLKEAGAVSVSALTLARV